MRIRTANIVIESIAHRLGHEPTDEAVALAISQQLAINRLPVFLCDAATVKPEQTQLERTTDETPSETHE